MASQKRQSLVRFRPETYEKLKFVADSNHRSVSNQLEWIVLQFLDQYEAQNGTIRLESNTSVVQNNHHNSGGTYTQNITGV